LLFCAISDSSVARDLVRALRIDELHLAELAEALELGAVAAGASRMSASTCRTAPSRRRAGLVGAARIELHVEASIGFGCVADRSGILANAIVS
jgi:hypothetical protein